MGASTSTPVGPPALRPTPVLLHVYDMGMTAEVAVLNSVLRAVGAGAYHVGVEAHGREWSYRGLTHAGTGVFCRAPRCCEDHSYRETVQMGTTTLSEADVAKVIKVLKKEWIGLRYDLLKRNCCHFSNAFCYHLGVGPIPAWITLLASAGQAAAEPFEGVFTGLKCNRRDMVLKDVYFEEPQAPRRLGGEESEEEESGESEEEDRQHSRGRPRPQQPQRRRR
mmetsp:Transcript_29315/g.90255  ORF Transcript_29315/g.90255 Transcript_29315/m.90255 type:complete len:222 (-) Transcript_29315:97-762(-)